MLSTTQVFSVFEQIGLTHKMVLRFNAPVQNYPYVVLTPADEVEESPEAVRAQLFAGQAQCFRFARDHNLTLVARPKGF